MNLKISLGKEFESEQDIFLDLEKEHINTIVFSGQTGSAKSTFHHSVTEEIMANNKPDEVGFIFMDFKRVEYAEYKDSDYLLHPIVYDPKEAVVVLKDLIHESEQRFKGIKNPKKTIIVQIEECDIVLFAPGLLEEVWKKVDAQSEKNNMYMFFSSSRTSTDVFTPKLLNHSNLKAFFVPGGAWAKYYDEEMNAYSSLLLGHKLTYPPEPWTRIFQYKDGKEIVCKAFV